MNTLFELLLEITGGRGRPTKVSGVHPFSPQKGTHHASSDGWHGGIIDEANTSKSLYEHKILDSEYG